MDGLQGGPGRSFVFGRSVWPMCYKVDYLSSLSLSLSLSVCSAMNSPTSFLREGRPISPELEGSAQLLLTGTRPSSTAGPSWRARPIPAGLLPTLTSVFPVVPDRLVHDDEPTQKQPGRRASSVISLGHLMQGGASGRQQIRTPHPRNLGRLHTAILIAGAKQTAPPKTASLLTPPLRDFGADRIPELERAMSAAGDYETDFSLPRHAPSAGSEPEDHTSAAVDATMDLAQFDRRHRAMQRLALLAAMRRDAPPPELLPKPGRGGSAAQSDARTPPRVIDLIFRFRSVRNLPAVATLRRIGYPELHEQFSIAASECGIVHRSLFVAVLNANLPLRERTGCFKIMDCFAPTGNGHGDVPLATFLTGLRMLLECASAVDTLRFCFQLLVDSSNVPRYMTRYEAQSLVAFADEAAANETRRSLLRASAASPAKMKQVERMSVSDLVRRSADKQYLAMRRAIMEVVNDTSRYDYTGRMPLRDFLAVTIEASIAPPSPRSSHAIGNGQHKKEEELEEEALKRKRSEPTSPFVFGRGAWQSSPLDQCATSKQMIIASLAPPPQNAERRAKAAY